MNIFLTTVFLMVWFNALEMLEGRAFNQAVFVGLVALSIGLYGSYLDYKELTRTQ